MAGFAIAEEDDSDSRRRRNVHRGWEIGLIEAFILSAQALQPLSPGHASQSLRNTPCLANDGGWNALHRRVP